MLMAGRNHSGYEGLTPDTPIFLQKTAFLTNFQNYYYWCALRSLPLPVAAQPSCSSLFIYSIYLFPACWAKNAEKVFTSQRLNLSTRVMHSTEAPLMTLY
jgi:hypothetical protein